jgi:hypothetical protein
MYIGSCGQHAVSPACSPGNEEFPTKIAEGTAGQADRSYGLGDDLAHTEARFVSKQWRNDNLDPRAAVSYGYGTFASIDVRARTGYVVY